MDWIGRLPPGWRRLRLKYVTDFVNGAAFKPEEWGDTGTPIIRIENLNGSEDFNCTERRLPEKYVVSEGDLLFGWSGNIGTSFGPFWWTRSGRYYLNQHIFRVVRFSVYKRWLYWTLRAVTFEVETRVHGIIGLVHVTRPELDNTVVPVPADRCTQRFIADFLDRKTASIDALIEKQEQLLALLAEKRQALITQAVTKGLDPNVPMKDTGVAWFGQVPKHWEVSRIGYMAVVGNGSTPSREEARFWSEDENGYPWLNSARINDERIVRAERWVTCDALRECHLPKVPPGSVVVAITGEGQTRARAALLEIEATISQHLAYVRPRHGLNAVFLWRQLQAAYQWLRDQSAGGGSTRAALTCEFLRTVSIVVPPLAEQELIVSHIDSELRRIDSLSQRVQAMIDKLREYRQTLITAAVTGQLDVTPTIHSERRPSPQAEAV